MANSNKIGCFIIDLKSTELSPEEREMLAHPLVGGIILFTRNYESRQQLAHLCQQVRTAQKKPLLIMVDQEGGRVQRFIPEFSRLPRMAELGELYDTNPNAAIAMAKKCGMTMASELISAGVDLSLAPVLDLNKEICIAIGDRSFHADPRAVILLAQALVQGMKEMGMAATGKHFPGHGSVNTDSHTALPVDERSLDVIVKEDMVPFSALIKLNINAIMAAHIIFPAVDSLPVGYSSIWLKDILRGQLEFTGVVLSDDLNMEGANISANYADRVQASRDAGCDFTLLCNNHAGVIQVLDQLAAEKYNVSEEKWASLKANYKGNH
jgi:beta-N-acetylhexosaminidase